MSKLPSHALIVDIPIAAGKREKFLEVFTPFVKKSFEEPKTLTFYWVSPVDGDGSIFRGLELYEDHSALKDIHLKSAELHTFLSAVSNESLLSGDMILEHAKPVSGFLVRPNAPNHGNHSGAFIWAGKSVANVGKGDQVVDALLEILPYVESSEPETISFMVLRGIENPDIVYVWERYTNEHALRNVHQQTEMYKRMRERIDELVKVREIGGHREVMGFLTKEGLS